MLQFHLCRGSLAPLDPSFHPGLFFRCNVMKNQTSPAEDSAIRSRRRCECYDLFDRHVPYMEAWKWQKSMVESRTANLHKGSDADDAVIILQHSPVYTLGTHSSENFLLFDKDNPPCDLYRTERGGEVTYHGPGQLVMYPILNLRHHKMDLHWYLRSLEEVVIRALWSACSIEASRIEGLTGVWVGDKKVAAIGVRVTRWITYHGLALNVTTDLSPFTKIIPCGIDNRPVGSVFELLQSNREQPQVESRTNLLINACDEYDVRYLLDLMHHKLLKEFSEVFEIDLVRVSNGITALCTSF